MTHARTFDARSRRKTRAGWSVAFALVGGLLLFAEGCSEAWRGPLPLDCSQENSYEKIETYEPGLLEIRSTNAVTWYGYPDPTPGGSYSGEDAGAPPTRLIENGGRCGSTSALVLEAHGFNDFGSGFGDYDPGGLLAPCATSDSLTCPFDASGYEGIAFWARSPGETTKGVTLWITDGHSYDVQTAQTACVFYQTEAGTGGVTTYTVAAGNVSTGSSVASLQPPANACGNNFQYVLVTTPDWQLYKIPFSAFAQSALPNRSPAGFDPSTFFTFGMLVPREAMIELWIDDLGFYPKKGDGGL